MTTQLNQLSTAQLEHLLIFDGWISLNLYLKFQQVMKSSSLSMHELIEEIRDRSQLWLEFEDRLSSFFVTEKANIFSHELTQTITLVMVNSGRFDHKIERLIDQISPGLNSYNTIMDLSAIDKTPTLIIPPKVSSDDNITVETENGAQTDRQVTFQFFTETDERYCVTDQLGEGGMSVVERVTDRKMGREVALKRAKDTTNQLTLERFIVEARVNGRLEHPNILPIYDVMIDSLNPSYTMRIAECETLADKIKREHPLEVHDLCGILKQVALALEYAHLRGVIHRDLKPHNILLGEEGEVYLSDWGVCMLEPTHPDAHLMSADVRYALIGSPPYMPPEQAICDVKKIGPRSDVYGLGAVLYHGLTGSPPFKGMTLGTLLQQVSKDLPIPPSTLLKLDNLDPLFPSELEEICLKALEKNPADRFPSARAFSDVLEAFLKGQFEKERREQLMREAIERGDVERARYQILAKKRIDLEQLIFDLKSKYKRTRDLRVRESLWRQEEVIDSLSAPLEESFARATSAYRSALRQHSSSSKAKRQLCEMFWGRLEEAERANDLRRAAYFEEMIRELGDDEILGQLDRPSQLSFRSIHKETSIEVWSDHPQRYRTIRQKLFSYERPPKEPIKLTRGSYLIILNHERSAEVRVHLHIPRASEINLKCRLLKQDRLPEGFVYIRTNDEMSAYGMMQTPVTCESYFQFLNDLSTEEGDRHAPRYNNTVYIQRDHNQKFSLPFKDLEGDEWSARWPVMMINYYDAQKYANWLGQRVDRPLRLPSVEEWTWAAQGADHRPYPWGFSFDPNLCRMKDSTRGRTLPADVGTHPSDRSPFGVYDVAGNISQWTNSLVDGSDDIYEVCGAAFSSMELLCQFGQEQESPGSSCLLHVGFRLMCTFTEDDYL